MKRLAPRLAGFLLAAAAAHGVAAETPPIAEARDTPYPGTIALAVDATDLTHAIFRAHETIPVAGPGPLTLFYPKWLPGDHAPTGPLDKLAGLAVSANGKPLAWTRDPVDVYAFHLDVPADAAALDVDLQFVSPVSARDGRVMMTTRMLSLQWNDVMLYPAGYYARRIGVRASVTLPDGFIPETALPRAPGAGRTIAFEPVSLETLVDSPLLAGRNVKTVDLDPDGPVRVTLDMVGDDARDLAITPQQIVLHRALVRQAYRLFGARHFDHYDFLMSVSDHLGDIGLEHQQSSEDGVSATYFTNWDEGADDRDTLAHEFVHAWNGKFRRPADLWTPNFNLPMRDSLLWVYEGQTQYWGYVLAARAGLMTRQDALDAFALTAAVYGRRAGRTWRPLEDTTNDPLIAMREPLSWPSWQRSEDYYAEGQLLWLDVDTLIRQGSGGRRSLDDFARAFFGGANGLSPPSTYDFDDVVAALNQVRPYDWAGFLRERLERWALARRSTAWRAAAIAWSTPTNRPTISSAWRRS
jgi:predicted metalloprotease with PDZ domain